jgi:hypothetical protein
MARADKAFKRMFSHHMKYIDKHSFMVGEKSWVSVEIEIK